MSQNDAASQLQEYNDALKEKAKDLVHKVFLEKIIELNELLETPLFNKYDKAEIHEDLNVPIPDAIILKNTDGAPAKRPRLENDCSCDTGILLLPKGAVPCNRSICEMIGLVKPLIRELIENANLVKMWILNMVPKFDSGDDFGLSIQQKAIAKLARDQSQGIYLLDDILRYFSKRGRFVSKISKYPFIEDYRRNVADLDENQYFKLWLAVNEIRNRYYASHDFIIKNLEKIQNPLSNNEKGLY